MAILSRAEPNVESGANIDACVRHASAIRSPYSLLTSLRRRCTATTSRATRRESAVTSASNSGSKGAAVWPITYTCTPSAHLPRQQEPRCPSVDGLATDGLLLVVERLGELAQDDGLLRVQRDVGQRLGKDAEASERRRAEVLCAEFAGGTLESLREDARDCRARRCGGARRRGTRRARSGHRRRRAPGRRGCRRR
jgi:hypothetical protein